MKHSCMLYAKENKPTVSVSKNTDSLTLLSGVGELYFPIKRIIIALFIVCFSTVSFAQTQLDNTFIYSLPKTVLKVEINTEKVTEIPGTYYQYSRRYLGTENVIKEEKTSYRIKNVRVITEAVPDENRTYSLTLLGSKKSPLYNLSVTEKGILKGLNVENKELNHVGKKYRVEKEKASNPSDLLPLSEEYMLVSSDAKLAEGVAKQIYRIRENRMDLLSGDVENFPSDKDGLKTLLKEMDEMEQRLTAYFVGTTRVEETTTIVAYTPESENVNEVLFRFSSLKGVVSNDDLSGSPYYVKVDAKGNSLPPVVESKKTQKSTPVLYTIQPISAKVEITGTNTSLYTGEVSLPQLGTLIVLNSDVIKSATTKVLVDTQTGRLLKIEE